MTVYRYTVSLVLNLCPRGPMSPHPRPSRRPVYVRWEHIEHNQVKTVREPWALTAEGCPQCLCRGAVYRPEPSEAIEDATRMCAGCSTVWEYNREPEPVTDIRVQMIRQLRLAQGLQ